MVERKIEVGEVRDVDAVALEGAAVEEAATAVELIRLNDPSSDFRYDWRER